MTSIPSFHVFVTFALFFLLAILSLYNGQYPQIMFTNIVAEVPIGYPRNGQNGPKWIVVTSVQYPTEGIKNLAAQPGWNMVVVADTKTPWDWHYPGAHFLSIDKQKELFGNFSTQLPYKSYTRKNLGYLYAIMNGAEWIYDTDDDNKPYGLGLSQFDYEPTFIPGLRYVSKSNNISEKLFNPYRFYGFVNMWPRGFPLEYIEGHTNGNDRMVSCRQMKFPVVQQGIVKADPDVDAIYRLLYAQKEGGLNVSFKNIAPPIVLDGGTYAPWNSQNTLFHYKAFFIMYLPTTVAFRVTDIWRSYFGQKLLQLIGENVAFYPTNAVHGNFSDFHQEIDVYEHSGKMVEFLDSWKCSYNDIVNCAFQLADGFVEHKFFGQEDRKLIEAWFQQLKRFGYVFPPLTYGKSSEPLGGKLSNCRTANFDVGVDKFQSNEDKEHVWATKTLNAFGEVLEWCDQATGNNDTFLPTAEEFLHHYKNLSGLRQKKDTVLVFVSNQPWRPAILGLLQRMYSSFFKTTIFCGTWSDPSTDPGLLPPIEPLNFVNISLEEMRNGASYGYCVPKVKNLRLRNVAGYYFMADDTLFNIWINLPLDNFLNPDPAVNDTFWWRPEQILRSYDAFENHYKNDPRFGTTWREHKDILQRAHPGVNVSDHYLNHPLKALADLVYIPNQLMEYAGNMMEVMTETEVFVEVAFGKMTDGLPYNLGGSFRYLWYERDAVWSIYNSTMLGLHPLKLGAAHIDLDFRKKYCNTVVKTFGKFIYGKN